MSELSPATQAVLDAASDVYWDWSTLSPSASHVIAAAALRAAADQVVPENLPDATYEFCCDYTQLRTQETIRLRFLAIADELEAQ